jgi:cysteine-rich repeat protein
MESTPSLMLPSSPDEGTARARRGLGLRQYAAWALATAFVLAGCGDEEKRAGLVLALQTDMSIPKDVDTVSIEVSTYGSIRFSESYPVGKDGVHIPATLTLLPAEDASTPVTIRVLSWQKGEARTLRRVVTTVPDNREATLRVPIEWLCDGQIEKDGEAVVSSCKKEGESCVAGTCAPDAVDSAVLPDFVPGSVFGGATADGQGTCFDTSPCFANNVAASELGLDLEACTLALEPSEDIGAGGSALGALDPEKLNFALVAPNGDGICGDWGCFIPLDRDDETGWSVDSSTVKLPPAVCTRITEATAELVATTACVAKTPDTPTCGDWSTVSGNTITVVDLDDLPPPLTGTGGTSSGGSSGTGAASSSGGGIEPSGGTGGVVNTGGTLTGGVGGTGGIATGGIGGTGGIATGGMGGAVGGSGGLGGASGGTGGATGRCAEMVMISTPGDFGYDTGFSTLNNVDYNNACASSAAGFDTTFSIDVPPHHRLHAAAPSGLLFTSTSCTDVGSTCISEANDISIPIFDNITESAVTLYLTVDSIPASSSHEGMLQVGLSQCMDGVVDYGESCDDGNNAKGDGCSDLCLLEPGWSCSMPGYPCDPCGDGNITGGETCDDGNYSAGDGCSDVCQIEPGWTCGQQGLPCTQL